MQQTKDLILTWMAGAEFCRSPFVKVFLASTKVLPPTVDVVVFTHDMPDDVRADLTGNAFTVKDISPHAVPFLCRDRYLVYWDYLLDVGHRYRYVLTTDSKDVLIQKNPFDWVEIWKERFRRVGGRNTFLENFVIFISEGLQLKDSPWNMKDQVEFQRDVFPPFMVHAPDNWVINSGLYLGCPEAIRNWFFLLWSVSMKSSGRATEQSTVNYLYNYLKEDETYSLTHPSHDTLCLTGEGLAKGFVKTAAFKDGQYQLLKEDESEPYFLVHQWDRLPERDSILSRFAS